MSGERIGKFKDQNSRDRKPYSRPKGIIKKVTDSFSELLSSTWVPGFLRTEEKKEDESGDKTSQEFLAPSINKQPHYPEEDGDRDTLALSRILPDHAYSSNISANLTSGPSTSVSTSSNKVTSTPYFPSVELKTSRPSFLKSSSKTYQELSKIVETPVQSQEERRNKRPLSNSPTEIPLSTPSSFLSQSAIKRPRFSLAAYSAIGNTTSSSPLSDSSFRSSPYYPGRTAYGGAASCRRPGTPIVKTVKAAPASTTDGLSDAAQRILSAINSLSTPLSDAKRVPTPTASPYSSYLDSPYTTAFNRHKPPVRTLTTPQKASVSHPVMALEESTSKDDSRFQQNELPSTLEKPSIFSVAAASSRVSKSNDSKSDLASPISIKSSAPLSSNNFTRTSSRETDSEKSISTSSGMRTELLKSQAASASTNPSYESRAGTSGVGKVTRGKQFTRHSSSAKMAFDEPLVVPNLPAASLPKINFSGPLSLAVAPPPTEQIATDPFSFRNPEVIEEAQVHISTPSSLFKFRNPVDVNRESSAPNFSPKKKKSPVKSQQKTQSSNFSVPEKSQTVVSKETKSTVVGFGDKFKPSVGSWECSGCLILNKSDVSECVACGTRNESKNSPKSLDSDPSSKSTQEQTSVPISSFGDKFKPTEGSWECSVCMLSNKPEAEVCVACETAKLGASSSKTRLSCILEKKSIPEKPSGFSFGVSSKESKSENTVSSFSFGVTGGATNKSSETGYKSATAVPQDLLKVNFGVPPSDKLSSVTSKKNSESPIGGTSKKTTELDSSINKINKNPTNFSEKEKVEVANIGFGDKFKKAPGDWECSVCMVNNKASDIKCISCESSKPGSVDKSKLNTGNFKFNTQSGTESSFSFGVATSSIPISTAPKTFSFGSSSSNNTKSSIFGSTDPTNSESEKSSLTTSGPQSSQSSFGTSVSSSQSTNAFTFESAPVTSSSSASTFALPTLAASSGPSTSLPTPAASSAPASSLSTPTTSAPTSSLPAPTSSIFSFGSAPKTTSEDTTAKKDNSLFSFGSSTTSNGVSKSSENSLSNSNQGFSFSAPSSTLKTKLPQVAPSSELKNGPSDIVLSSDKKTPSLFSFGSSSSTSDSNKTSLFSSVKSDSNQSSNSFSFKKDAPAVNGTSGNLNNNSAFGGSQFNFQFKSSEKASTNGANLVFGGTNANINNNNNEVDKKSIFAFGKPAEDKKQPNTSFDFGQAAAAPSFNFGGNAAPVFGAPQANNNNNNGGIFQFGNSSVAPAGGAPSANFFSPTGPPPGRVIRKPVRRNRK